MQGTLSGKNPAGEPFSNEMFFRARTTEQDGKIVLTELKETVDPKAREIIVKTI
jgi:hypothetical protein